MCELLVWTEPRESGASPGRPDRGGVTAVRPDGWLWGAKELAGERVLIVKFPGVPVDDLIHLVDRIQATDDLVLDRHRYIIDIAAIESSRKPPDRSRGPLTYTKQNLLSRTVQRIVADPRVIG